MTDKPTLSAGKTSSRRKFLMTAGIGSLSALGASGSAYWIGRGQRASRSLGKKVIVIGIDGMDPKLTATMMRAGRLPNLSKMSRKGGFSPLGTSIPPQSPVAWASFINGAGPGSHGLFDFIHRHPEQQCAPFFSAAETLPAEGGWNWGDHRLQLDFWPFNHRPAETVLKRQGVPFWDFLDAQGIPTTFYDLPSNYPPSPSQYGHHRCLSGMGTPDLLGSYGTYQYFAEDVPETGVEEGGGRRSRVVFDREAVTIDLVGPENSLLRDSQAVTCRLRVYRDRSANSVVLDLGSRRIPLKAGDWSPWVQLPFTLSSPSPLPSQQITGVVRFLVQEVQPTFRLYVSPVNIDPSAPAVTISEPQTFVADISQDLGLFATTGFQEDHKARSNGVFTDDDYLRQTQQVLEERLALFEYAVNHYEDGLLFFYFSSSDLQSHMFWWHSDDPHPLRAPAEAVHFYEHIQRLYQKLDQVIGDLYDRYGDKATIMVMSDHGFSNFGRQFNLNSWLRDLGYLGPTDCTSIMQNCDWSQTVAYGLGINGLYLNRKGRERDGIVEPGDETESLLRELIQGLEDVRDFNGQPVIRKVYRADEVYTGQATALAPDLVIGYARGYRASWATCLGDLTEEVLLDNDSAWSADHCCDASEVPGLLCCNQPLQQAAPTLIDLAPSILAQFGLTTPSTMTGRNLFQS